MSSLTNNTPRGTSASTLPRRSVKPYGFIVGFGLVSMLMDVVYEAALAVQGPLLAGLGASAALVGLISGLGEATALVGRLFSGPLADRTGRYWMFAILGYAATALAVPAMGFVGSVGAVGFLVVFERFGKSLRTPSRDAMLSHAASAVGRGKGFALHEVMDQIGAMGGPLIVAALLSATANDYRVALGVLVVPGLAAICVLLALRHRVPQPQVFEPEEGDGLDGKATAGNTQASQAAECEPRQAAEHMQAEEPWLADASGATEDASAIDRERESRPASGANAPRQARGGTFRQFPRVFWLYALSCGVMLAGVATFGVLSFHMVSTNLVVEPLVPVIYAVAMGIDAVFALITGFAYDRFGTKVLLVLPLMAAAIPHFAYQPSVWAVVVGVVLWGASLGIQESTMKAAVSELVGSSSRASAYGMFSVFVGIGSLVGGTVAGALYAQSVAALATYAFVVELAALALMFAALRRAR